MLFKIIISNLFILIFIEIHSKFPNNFNSKIICLEFCTLVLCLLTVFTLPDQPRKLQTAHKKSKKVLTEKIYQWRKSHKSLQSLPPFEFCIKMAQTFIKVLYTGEILIYVISAVRNQVSVRT